MERNKWETAIRCLEIAAHPSTSDKEVIAAVNGFRRTADGAPLSQLCRELAGSSPTFAERQDQLHRLERENRELQQQIAAAEGGRIAALRRLEEVERNARDIAEELFAAEHRAETAERRLAEFQGAYGRLSGGLRSENRGLRHELEASRHTPPAPPPRQAAPFQHILDAALRQQPALAQPTPAAPMSGRPWTA